MKKTHERGSKLDVFDLINFCKFFKDLYGKTTLLDSETERFSLATEHHNDSEIKRLQGALDEDITVVVPV